MDIFPTRDYIGITFSWLNVKGIEKRDYYDEHISIFRQTNTYGKVNHKELLHDCSKISPKFLVSFFFLLSFFLGGVGWGVGSLGLILESHVVILNLLNDSLHLILSSETADIF